MRIVRKYWPLLIILLIGSVLRFYGLLQNPISLYSDEVDMGYQALSLLKTGCDYSGYCLPIQFHSFSDVQPPVPIYLIALFHLLGFSLDLAIRFPSAVFGVLGILLTYLLVEKLASKKMFNLELPHLSLITSFLIAIIPWHLTYSRIGFALSLLYFFVTAGFYFFTVYLTKKKDIYLYLSCLFLGLSPMVYNTAKMSILFYPFVLLLLPGAWDLFKSTLRLKLVLAVMFIPLVVMFIGGKTTARFDYISIFTDPTASTEVNFARYSDLGPSAQVGTSPSLLTQFIHNKPLWFGNRLSNNVFNLLSTDFLFIKGDPNLRHSPANWGMLYRSLAPLILIGLYFLIRNRQNRLLLILASLIVIAISTSAITRDGGSHGSRSFMLIQPLIILIGIGLAYTLKHVKALGFLLLGFIFLEASFFVHDYWYHYRYYSATSFSFGMKEIIESSNKYLGRPIVISPKNENPLIFYAYYNQYDPKKFQQLVQSHVLYNNTNGSYNLDGNRIGNSDLYIASLVDYHNRSNDGLLGAVYYLTKLEAENSGVLSVATKSAIIKLPSGEPLYYEIHF